MGRENTKIEIGLLHFKAAKPWLGDGKFNLSKVTETLRYLDDPHDALRSVHIAGTNGKGSSSSAIASILGAAGFKVGLNISPHLFKLNERIVIDGLPVSDEWLGEFSYEVKKASEKAYVTLSFHELITCVAFLGFRESGLEWGVYEVGLGGKLDASNVLNKPAVACITSIDYDHQDILGKTLPEIAENKAGIIKSGVPTVLGELSQEVKKVFDKYGNRSKLHYFNSDFGCKNPVIREDGRAKFEFWNGNKDSSLGEIDNSLPGFHQISNMALSVRAGLEVGVSFEQCQKGIKNVFWPARLESFVYGNKRIIIDSAHNPAGIRALLQYLKSVNIERYHLVFGVLETKNWLEMLTLLKAGAHSVAFVSPESERALRNQFLTEALSGTDIRISDYGRDYDKFIKELPQIENELPVLICGSIYLVGRIRNLLGQQDKPLWQKRTI